MAGSMKDSQNRPRVVVTGMGVVSSLGVGLADNWRALIAGSSGVRRIDRFSLDGLKTTIAATVALEPGEAARGQDLATRMAHQAAAEAIAQACIGGAGSFPGPLVVGSPPVEADWPLREEIAADAPAAGSGYAELAGTAASGRYRALFPRTIIGAIADAISDRFGTRGAPISLSTACSSGASAIQIGLETIRRSEAEAVLAVATDGSVQAENVIRFSLLSALSTRNEPPETASRPFAKDRDGFVMGEGAGALVLESEAAARARGARILGYVLGAGDCSDSFHRTRSAPDGAPIVRTISEAIADAGLTPDLIDCINAHGTSTPENDKMEAMGCAKVFGDRAGQVATTSNKSMIGHTLSAAGAVEAIFSLASIAAQRIPPTINHQLADPAIPLDIVGNVARDARIRTVLSNSFGFGGQNVCLVLAAEPLA